jgi:hypothetical protein
MDLFTDYKIIKKTGWFSGGGFKVVERKLRSGKPAIIESEVVAFQGDLLSCEAYIRLSERQVIEK